MKKYWLLWMTPLLLLSGLARGDALPGPLVEPDWLAAHLDDVVVLDVRKDVKSFTAQARLARDKKTKKLKVRAVGGHIPGASLIDYKKLRGDRQIDGRKVTRMLLSRADFQALMQSAGVKADKPIVVVSKGMSAGDLVMAARLYWNLKYYGQDEVAILNGGMAQWLLEQRPVTLDTSSAKGDWTSAGERAELLAGSEDVAAGLTQGVQLVDVRSLPLYLGTSQRAYVYDKGHIPGAKVFPPELVATETVPARFLAVDELRGLHKAMGIDASKASITYCNSGSLAAIDWFVLHELLGNKQVSLYDGSLHQWTMEKRPMRAMTLD